MAEAHTADEFVELSQLQQISERYLHILNHPNLNRPNLNHPKS